MRHVRSLIIGLACLTVLFGSAMAQQDSDVVGKVTRIEKAAVALQDAIPRPLAIGSGIQLGDIISTGKGARLEFEMNDGSKVQLGERSKFVVLEFIVNNNGGNAVMRMIEGAFAVSSGKLMQLADASMTVKTESATIGIRGTTFWGGMIDGTFEVALLAGKSIYVETKAGRVDIDKIGEGSRIVSANEAPSKPAQWPAGKLERAKATVKFSN